MLRLQDVLMIGGIFCSFVTSILLFIKGSNYRHANRQLGIILFSCGWYALLYLLFIGGWLKDIPYIFRIGSPLYYLIPPLSYLYVRSVLYNETSFKQSDWLHFIPAAINFVELMPFYFADTAVKKQVIQDITKDINLIYLKGSGFVPVVVHATLRPVQGVIYLLFQWFILLRYYFIQKKKGHTPLPENKRWLFIFSGFLTTIYVALAVITVTGLRILGSGIDLLELCKGPVLAMNFAFFGFSVYLFFKPNILYGTRTLQPAVTEPQPEEPSSVITPIPENIFTADEIPEENRQTKKELLLHEDLIKNYCEKLELYITEQQAFRKQGLTLNTLSDTLDIPRHHLSHVLNKHYQQRFTDFINMYRVDYIRQRMQDDDWKGMTLEALGEEAGFSSRSTFFSAFKKNTGFSPSEYQKQEGL